MLTTTKDVRAEAREIAAHGRECGYASPPYPRCDNPNEIEVEQQMWERLGWWRLGRRPKSIAEYDAPMRKTDWGCR